jgi:ABC-type sugar transport system permease subunit
LIDFWVYCPFVIILIVAGLQSLPKSPFELRALMVALPGSPSRT